MLAHLCGGTCKEKIEVVEVTERAVTYVKLKYDNFNGPVL